MKHYFYLLFFLLFFSFFAILLKYKESPVITLSISEQDNRDLENIKNFLQSKNLSFHEKTLVHFYGTFCEPCKRELPELLNFLKKNSYVVFFICEGSDCDQLKFPMLRITLEDINEISFPTTLFIEKDIILWSKIGPYDWSKDLSKVKDL